MKDDGVQVLTTETNIPTNSKQLRLPPEPNNAGLYHAHNYSNAFFIQIFSFLNITFLTLKCFHTLKGSGRSTVHFDSRHDTGDEFEELQNSRQSNG